MIHCCAIGMTGFIPMKREIPLFIIDTARTHKRGECDFLVCTDKDNGFVAKVDYIEGECEEFGDDYRIDYPQRGISCRIQIQQMIGTNSRVSEVRTLLKRGMEYYAKAVRSAFNVEHPTKEECVKYLELLMRSNRQYLDESGSDYEARKTIATSLAMLQAATEYLRD